MSNNSNTAPRLNCEVLEGRDNPSGNVNVFISGGIIFAEGDAADNRISLQQNQFGDVFIFGLDNTTVNGQSSLYLGTGIPNGVRFFLGDGNDRVELVGLTLNGGVRVEMGAGNDQTFVLGTAARESIDIFGNDGDDEAYLSNVSTNFYVILAGGNGFDSVHVDNTVTQQGVFVYDTERAW